MGDPWLAAHGWVAQQKPEGTANNPEGTANTNATRQQWLKEALGGLDNLQPALRALAER
ncbi:MAG: hypothetical protein VKK98_07400 [Cyanobacteriota bacterium]|nr:hypothetical protein [Cyanobacteriota bacterium]